MDKRPIDHKASDKHSYDRGEVFLQYASVYGDIVKLIVSKYQEEKPENRDIVKNVNRIRLSHIKKYDTGLRFA